MQVRTLASVGVKDQHGCMLQHRSQMRLGSSIAVAVAQQDPPSLESSICHRCGHKKKKKKKCVSQARRASEKRTEKKEAERLGYHLLHPGRLHPETTGNLGG